MVTYVTRMKKNATEHAKQEIYRQHQELKNDTVKIADLLDIYTDDSLSGDEQFKEIKQIERHKLSGQLCQVKET